MTALLELSDVEVRYGAVRALRGVSLEVRQGEIVAVLGSNGAGKTTTLRTVSGLLRPVGGQVRFEGRRIDGTPPHRIVGGGISHVPEGRRIFAQMSVLENLEMGAFQRRGSTADELELVYGLFPVLKERRRQAGGTLSGGEQQMLAIGRALMSRPRLLLLDEPSMGLAPMVVARIFTILADIKRTGTTLLLVEQNAAQALAVADRGYVLETGEVVMSGSAADLAGDDRIRAAYLGEALT
ncbi:MAG: ABC transporter ATP-binding protein [Acidobacteriota bacterium]|nr:ABC transporter ATP-binding protein [Acidobacteriota bacterium]